MKNNKNIRLSIKDIKIANEACHYAAWYELDFINAYSNVHDGSEKLPVSNSLKNIDKFKKLSKKIDKILEAINEKE